MSNDSVVILYNLPAEVTDAPGAAWRESDEGVLNEVNAVAAALRELGIPHRQAGVRRLAHVAPTLASTPAAVVFNLVERLDDGIESCNEVPDLCTRLGHPCTGSDSACLSLTLDKWRAKSCFAAAGIGVPAGALVSPGAAPGPAAPGAPPWIVKPVSSDGSEGIEAASVAATPAALAAAIARVHARCAQAALVEQFIDGREFNLSVIERNGRVEVLPIAEIDFSLFPPDRPHIVDYAVKWIPGTIPGQISPRRVPANVDDRTAGLLRQQALRTWRAAGCRDYVRVDLRLNPAGQVFVLEVNANPDISPKAGLPACLTAAGIPFSAFVCGIVDNALARAGR